MTRWGWLCWLAFTLACGATRPATTEPEAAEPGASQPNDVQLDCRSDSMLDIGEADAAFGPTCVHPTMPIALMTFDLGSYVGYSEASAWADAMFLMCACANGTCTPENETNATSNASRVMVDEFGKREREGVFKVTKSLASHECLSAPIGVALFKLGYACGFATGLHSQMIRREMHKHFLKLESGDESKATEEADACFAGLQAKKP